MTWQHKFLGLFFPANGLAKLAQQLFVGMLNGLNCDWSFSCCTCKEGHMTCKGRNLHPLQVTQPIKTFLNSGGISKSSKILGEKLEKTLFNGCSLT